MSSVVLTCGPSAVITRNLASGSLSPTLMVMVNSPCNGWGCLSPFSGQEETASPSFDGGECRNYLHVIGLALAPPDDRFWKTGRRSGRGLLLVAQFAAQDLADIGLRQVGAEFD